jgi:hypothetical protein
MKTHVEPDARAGRFSARFAYHDDPQVFERLERAAHAEATSAAAIVRSAVRHWLAERDEDGGVDERQHRSFTSHRRMA